MAKISKEELRETRKQMMAQMEQRLQEMHPKEEDRMFYYHSSEDCIVLSHAVYWTMTKKMSEGRSKMSDVRNEHGKFFSLIRQYQEELLDAFLPKSKYPFLALSFMNLIPSCQTCNMKDCKGNNDPVKFAPTGVQYLIQYPYQFDASKIEFKYVLNGTSYNKDDNFDVEVDYKGDKELKKGYNNYLKTEEFYKCHNVEVAGMYRQMMILASKAKFFYEKMGMRKFWLQPTPMLLMGYNFSEESSGKYMLYKFKHDIYLQMMNGEVGKIFKMK